MTDAPLGRRAFLGGTAALALGSSAQTVAAAPGETDMFTYAVTRTDAEWREMLSEIEHFVLREGGTESPHTSPLWNEERVGTYCCKGCDLALYASLQKIQLDKGWAFFFHSFENTVLTSLDTGGIDMGDPFARMAAMMEVHCRRCGSHLGHIVALPDAPGKPIHCINGFALEFQPADV